MPGFIAFETVPNVTCMSWKGSRNALGGSKYSLFREDASTNTLQFLIGFWW